MEPLFEAKALYENEYALYNIFRLERGRYKAQLITDEDGNYDAAAPMELILCKREGQWHPEDNGPNELATTLGMEIDAFNNGYGAILGRIGIE